MKKLQKFIAQHRLAICLAILVGLISVAPQIIFIYSAGPSYQGIHMLATDNEDDYLTRLNEIDDGHISLGSPWFYEYKNEPPLFPPTPELLVVAISKILFLSLANTLIALKFIFPASLFILVYLLTYQLLARSDFFAKLTATTSALLVTLGYDIVGSITKFNFLSSITESQSFLVWTRPINPIIGALIVFSCLLIVWSLNKKITKIKIISGGLLFALGLSTYFFTWAILLSIIGWLGLLYLIQKKFHLFKSLVAIICLGIVFALPYFYNTTIASQHQYYTATIGRVGLIYGHQPMMNKVLMVALIIFLAYGVNLLRKKRQIFSSENNWWWFCLMLIIGGMWALNQQVFTGLSVWAPHFVQYTIPLTLMALMVLLDKISLPKLKYVWYIVIALIIFSSTIFGIGQQTYAYINNYDEYLQAQKLWPIFEWFNQNTEKDSVVFVLENDNQNIHLRDLLPAYTHNNVYASSLVFALMPIERIAHNYMADRKFENIEPDQINDYIQNNLIQHKAYFGGIADWKELHESKIYRQNKDLVKDSYDTFYNSDFYTELKKYRLDYILSKNELGEEIINQLPQLELAEEINGYYIYQLP